MFTLRSQSTPSRRLRRPLVIAFTALGLLLALEVPAAGAVTATSDDARTDEASGQVEDAARQLWSALQQRRQAEQASRVEAFLAVIAAAQAQAEADRINPVLDAGRAKLGTPYRLGGTGPGAFDCSGFTRWAWQAAGVELPHYSGAQWDQSTHIAIEDLKPGDLVFYWGRGSGDPSHVALYVGDGQILHAPGSGRSVRYDSIWYWSSARVAAGRVG
jgi:cell wall-associated NlpC family hydrolase